MELPHDSSETSVFTLSAGGRSFEFKYIDGSVLMIPSNLTSGYQDEDFAEIDSFTAPKYAEDGETASMLLGDADESGKIDILDVITVNKAILGKEKLSKQGELNCDVNKSGKPDSGDSLMIMKFIVGLIENFE